MATRVFDSDVLLGPADVQHQPFDRTILGAAGVVDRVLTEHAGEIAGILRIPRGTSIPMHEHAHMSHHVWVVDGTAVVDGRMMPSGSYWFVAAGHVHAIDGAAPDGCTLFYVDVPVR